MFLFSLSLFAKYGAPLIANQIYQRNVKNISDKYGVNIENISKSDEEKLEKILNNIDEKNFDIVEFYEALESGDKEYLNEKAKEFLSEKELEELTKLFSIYEENENTTNTEEF